MHDHPTFMSIPTSPAFILVRPQMGENIGAAARVMANFGLSDLRLVEPRDGWPNQKAIDMAAGASGVIERVGLFANTAESVAELQSVIALTARTRQMDKPLHEVREALQELAKRQAGGERVGILFGPERTGLSNEDVALADTLATIPVDASFPSLNLAQAVAVVAYEWGQCAAANTVPYQQEELPATKQEVQALFDHLEQALDAGNFWRVPEKKEAMWHNIRAMLQRGSLSAQEVRTLHGIIRCLREFHE